MKLATLIAKITSLGFVGIGVFAMYVSSFPALESITRVAWFLLGCVLWAFGYLTFVKVEVD